MRYIYNFPKEKLEKLDIKLEGNLSNEDNKYVFAFEFEQQPSVEELIKVLTAVSASYIHEGYPVIYGSIIDGEEDEEQYETIKEEIKKTLDSMTKMSEQNSKEQTAMQNLFAHFSAELENSELKYMVPIIYYKEPDYKVEYYFSIDNPKLILVNVIGKDAPLDKDVVFENIRARLAVSELYLYYNKGRLSTVEEENE